MQKRLDNICNNRDRFDLEIWAGLAMQQHYGENPYEGVLTSDFFKAHPEWQRWRNNVQQADGSEVCYFFQKSVMNASTFDLRSSVKKSMDY